jgi:hypothetical protein
MKKKTATTKAVSLELPRNPFVFEVLDLVSKQRSKAKKIEVLKKYEHVSLKATLIWNFDESIISMLPEGEVPYSGFEDQASSNGTLSTKISEEVRRMHETDSFSMGSSDKNGHTTIRREFKNFYHFLRGGNDAMSGVRRETMFINILEGLHPLEAEVVCLCKDKKLSERYNITKEIVTEAYPDITWGNRS